MLAASMVPGAEPAPTNVCISSIKTMISGFFFSSERIARMRSSNCPRYFVPATTPPRSSEMTRLFHRLREISLLTMRSASPSTMALLPTPGSPISTGLFFLRRQRICATRSISRVRPTTGSSLPSAAIFVRSVPKLSKAGVAVRLALSLCEVVRVGPSSSSSSSSAKPNPFFMLPWGWTHSITAL